ncbi:DNA-deoxyinosine glycosylase [Campylobacter sp. MOP7]|uniref:DNA-deoxyinosine glycosylase n=1 Tax=Campylobacter canis TaxID=3378588 RepID=UPI00387E82CB
MKKLEINNLPPIFNEDCEILILGSFPSTKSRQAEFYYSNPANKFWQILSVVFDESQPNSKDEKLDFLKRHKIALYDAATSCDIKGSLDSHMSNVSPTDLSQIFSKANIKRVFTNGKKADGLCRRFHLDFITQKCGCEPVCLLSTSAANARFTMDKKIENWKQILVR